MTYCGGLRKAQKHYILRYYVTTIKQIPSHKLAHMYKKSFQACLYKKSFQWTFANQWPALDFHLIEPFLEELEM